MILDWLSTAIRWNSIHWREKIDLLEATLNKEKLSMLAGRQILFQIFSFYDINKTQGPMGSSNLLNIEMYNDNIEQFNQAWEDISLDLDKKIEVFTFEEYCSEVSKVKITGHWYSRRSETCKIISRKERWSQKKQQQHTSRKTVKRKSKIADRGLRMAHVRRGRNAHSNTVSTKTEKGKKDKDRDDLLQRKISG